jgi:Thioredoxin domain
MNVKILAPGFSSCRSMYNDVTRIIARNRRKVDVEYVQDIARIMSYGVMVTPVLVIDEKVIMVGHGGPSKIDMSTRPQVKPLKSAR